ncbi:MAG: hypothetical protein ACYTXE_36690 [Nostoc sp.]
MLKGIKNGTVTQKPKLPGYRDGGLSLVTYPAEERFWLQERLRLEYELKLSHNSYTLLQALVNPKVWLLSLIYFTLVIGLYGISFWLPQIIKGFSELLEEQQEFDFSS